MSNHINDCEYSQIFEKYVEIQNIHTDYIEFYRLFFLKSYLFLYSACEIEINSNNEHSYFKTLTRLLSEINSLSKKLFLRERHDFLVFWLEIRQENRESIKVSQFLKRIVSDLFSKTSFSIEDDQFLYPEDRILYEYSSYIKVGSLLNVSFDDFKYRFLDNQKMSIDNKEIVISQMIDCLRRKYKHTIEYIDHIKNTIIDKYTTITNESVSLIQKSIQQNTIINRGLSGLNGKFEYNSYSYLKNSYLKITPYSLSNQIINNKKDICLKDTISVYKQRKCHMFQIHKHQSISKENFNISYLHNNQAINKKIIRLFRKYLIRKSRQTQGGLSQIGMSIVKKRIIPPFCLNESNDIISDNSKNSKDNYSYRKVQYKSFSIAYMKWLFGYEEVRFLYKNFLDEVLKNTSHFSFKKHKFSESQWKLLMYYINNLSDIY